MAFNVIRIPGCASKSGMWGSVLLVGVRHTGELAGHADMLLHKFERLGKGGALPADVILTLRYEEMHGRI